MAGVLMRDYGRGSINMRLVFGMLASGLVLGWIVGMLSTLTWISPLS